MATAKDVLIAQLTAGKTFYDLFTSDLSDEEYFHLPCPGSNHVAWNVGHIGCAEDSITAQLTGAKPRIPESTNALFKGGSTCLPDASKYPSRKEIDALFRDSRSRTVEALLAFDVSKWGQPSPERWLKSPFPTVGALWGLQGTHQFWHLGQITVCRQALGKKRLF